MSGCHPCRTDLVRILFFARPFLFYFFVKKIITKHPEKISSGCRSRSPPVVCFSLFFLQKHFPQYMFLNVRNANLFLPASCLRNGRECCHCCHAPCRATPPCELTDKSIIPKWAAGSSAQACHLLQRHPQRSTVWILGRILGPDLGPDVCPDAGPDACPD